MSELTAALYLTPQGEFCLSPLYLRQASVVLPRLIFTFCPFSYPSGQSDVLKEHLFVDLLSVTAGEDLALFNTSVFTHLKRYLNASLPVLFSLNTWSYFNTSERVQEITVVL